MEHQKCIKRAETLVNQPDDSRTVAKGACHCLAHLTMDIKELPKKTEFKISIKLS